MRIIILLTVILITVSSNAYAQCDYYPLIDTVRIFVNSAAQDTLLYNLEVAENKNVLVVESRKNGFLYENEIIIDSQYFKVKNEFGSVDIGFSLNPKKGEVYVGQDRNSRVETVDAVINISSHKFKNVLVQNTWSGESSFHCKLYYARGVGLIRFDCDGSGSYEILLE